MIRRVNGIPAQFLKKGNNSPQLCSVLLPTETPRTNGTYDIQMSVFPCQSNGQFHTTQVAEEYAFLSLKHRTNDFTPSFSDYTRFIGLTRNLVRQITVKKRFCHFIQLIEHTISAGLRA
jgi:hypothetical protein